MYKNKSRPMYFGLVSILILAVAGCTHAPERAGPIEKGDYGFLATYLDWMIPTEMQRANVPGVSIAVVDDQRVVWSKGYGFADVAHKIPATPETFYRVGSISKLLTATEITRRAERGEIALDGPLAAQLPGFTINNRFRDAKPLTVRSLLAHHSGLPTNYLKGMWEPNPAPLTQLQTVLRTESLVAAPQTEYRYSNVGYSLLGRLIEEKSGAVFSAAMRTGVLQPIGMRQSQFVRTADSNAAHARGYRGGKEIAAVGVRDEPAGGLLSNVGEMAKFVSFALADGRVGTTQLIRPDSLRAMFEPQFDGLPLDFGHQVGSGWMLSGLQVPGAGRLSWHNGQYPGYFAHLVIARTHKLGVVVLANDERARGFAHQVGNKALELALEAKLGERMAKNDAPKEIARVAVPPALLADYAGDYGLFGNIVKISRADGQLAVNAFGYNLNLIPVAHDRFVPQARVLGLFNFPLPDLAVRFAVVEGKRFAVIEGFPAPLPLERIVKKAIPRAWQARVGRYRCENCDATIDVHQLELLVEDRVLIADLKLSSHVNGYENAQGRAALDPVSDDEAVIIGGGSSDGSVLQAVAVDGNAGLYYSGYRLRRIDVPH